MPTLAEQVAALEAKLDHMRKKYEDCRADLAVAESRLASARVEGAREALTRCAVKYATDGRIGTAERVADFRDREYPAPAAPAGEQGKSDVLRCEVCAYADGHASWCRPAPTPDLDAVVERVSWLADRLYGLPGEPQLLKLTPRLAEQYAGDLRTLLAHLQRQEGAA